MPADPAQAEAQQMAEQARDVLTKLMARRQVLALLNPPTHGVAYAVADADMLAIIARALTDARRAVWTDIEQTAERWALANNRIDMLSERRAYEAVAIYCRNRIAAEGL